VTSSVAEITDAVILMAGTGSRLAAGGTGGPKPLLSIGRRPLISYTIDALISVGVQKIHAVVGANADPLVSGLRAVVPSGVALNVIVNVDWRKQNGVSLLCAANDVTAPFFLTMGDHIFDRSILDDLILRSDPGCLNLAIDKKISSIFDLDDAMKVQTRSDRVEDIGKDLLAFDAIDTGIFFCPDLIFDYLRRAQRHGDCSLADGVRLMARDRRVMAIDIGEAWWQDVDTPEMLESAEQQCARLTSS